MNYFFIAGEPSGDMHAARLMAEIKKEDPGACFTCYGGDMMEKAGGKLLKHYREMAFMGLLPVLMNLGKIRKNLHDCKRDLLNYSPDVLVLVDYPGFNLRMARFAKGKGLRIAYYISPKIWAWNTSRVELVKAFVDDMYTILPFETEFYSKYNYPVHYVGNPVSDLINEYLAHTGNENYFMKNAEPDPRPVVALLAGSRIHEIKLLLPVMEEVALSMPAYRFIIAGAPGASPALYHRLLKSPLTVVFNQTYDLMKTSRAALVASGTATLEAALLNIPQVVCYKMGIGWLMEMFKNQVLKTRFFSLVNLIAGKEIVKEFFQSQVTVPVLKNELTRLLEDSDYREQMLAGYSEIALKLKANGEAARNTAYLIVEKLKKQQE